MDDRLEVFFSQSLDGFFFMMLDEPVEWGEHVNKDAVIDYVFDHQRMTKVNAAMLTQFHAASPGTFPYVCTLHPGMKGTLIVTP